MKTKSTPSAFMLTCLIFIAPFLGAQELSTQANPELAFPLGDSAAIWSLGLGAESQLLLSLPPGFPELRPFASAGVRVFPNDAKKPLSLTTGGLGVDYRLGLGDRWGAGATVSGGLYQATYDGLQASNLYWEAGAQARYRITPAFEVGLGTSWQSFQSRGGSLIDAMAIQLTAQVGWDGFQEKGRIQTSKIDLKPLFPVLYSQYDKQKLGSIQLTNHESGEIQDLRVTFFVKQFMERPKECVVIPAVKRGESIEAPLYALLTSEVLKLIESTKVLAEVSIEYKFLGGTKKQTFESPLRVYNRNAMSWDDDRKASAFVSSKDPAVLRYSKFVAGIIRNQSLQGVGQNLQYGIGLFECLKLMGINYVVDPTTPYTDFSANTASVDFLQFPYQTLTYRGGDCDDLSILFASILQSVGIRTAFITVPGHIYIAFALDMSDRSASSLFANLDNLINKDGTLWVPLEITMLGGDFTKAWAYGAQEWKDAGDKAKLFPMDDSWQVYDPVSPPEQDTRITLPDPAQIVAQLTSGLARFAEANLPPKLAALNSSLASATGADKGRVWNSIGILYAKYGKFAESKDAFLSATKAGYTLADTNLGNIALLQKDFPTAQSRFEKAQRANPTDFPTILGLAMTYYETERYTEAAAQYQKLFAMDPNRANDYLYLSKGQGGKK